MMDEQEMKKIISEVLYENPRVMYIPDLAPYLLEKLDKAGYRKPREYEVVLSKEEYDGLKKQVHALEHLATCYSEQIDWDNDIRKETAKEILQEFWKIQWGQNELDNVCIRLAQKYGVEVEL